MALSDPIKARPAFNRQTLLILSAAVILSAAMGIRQTFGLFVEPFSLDRGLPVTLIAFAIAIHNLVWGAAQPFAGAAADRWDRLQVQRGLQALQRAHSTQSVFSRSPSALESSAR